MRTIDRKDGGGDGKQSIARRTIEEFTILDNQEPLNRYKKHTVKFGVDALIEEKTDEQILVCFVRIP